jgi:hypothetical protein
MVRTGSHSVTNIPFQCRIFQQVSWVTCRLLQRSSAACWDLLLASMWNTRFPQVSEPANPPPAQPHFPQP